MHTVVTGIKRTICMSSCTDGRLHGSSGCWELKGFLLQLRHDHVADPSGLEVLLSTTHLSLLSALNILQRLGKHFV